MISQSSSEHSIYLVIYQKDLQKALKMLNNDYQQNIENRKLNIESFNDKSVISIITNEQKNILEISNVIFPLLHKKNINVYTHTSSDKNISLIVDRENVISSVNMIHNNLIIERKKNIFILGVGLVGNELVNQLNRIEDCNIVMLANSKKYILDLKGIKGDFKEKLKDGYDNNIPNIIDKIINLNLPDSVFIDCTSSENIYPFYEKLLNNGISLVTPNKKANTADYNIYRKLNKFSNYKFETTVGAGLPIVHTINNIKNCRDKVLKIEAILSGSLSYIFTTFMNNNKT